MASSAAIAQIRSDEGSRSRTYLDHLGNRTVGIGFNLERSDAREQLLLAGVSPDDIDDVMKEKGKALTDEQVEALFQNSVLEAEANAERYAGTGDIPQEVKDVLVNMSFQLGPTKLRRFVDTKAALERRDWQAFRAEMADSDWARDDTPARANRLIRSISHLEQPEPPAAERPVNPQTALAEERMAIRANKLGAMLSRADMVRKMGKALADSIAAEEAQPLDKHTEIKARPEPVEANKQTFIKDKPDPVQAIPNTVEI